MWKCSIGDESDVQIQTAPVSSIRRVDLSLGSFYHWKRPVELCRLSTEYEARGVSSHPRYLEALYYLQSLRNGHILNEEFANDLNFRTQGD
jgi:hypothetical protein